MRLMSLEVLKARRLEKKIRKDELSKQIEYGLMLELEEKLRDLLSDNDKVLLEVNPRVVGEFINVLDDEIMTMYDYRQVDQNKFIFYVKEIEL